VGLKPETKLASIFVSDRPEKRFVIFSLNIYLVLISYNSLNFALPGIRLGKMSDQRETVLTEIHALLCSTKGAITPRKLSGNI
jgi:hypothetical protein